jgi:hypothetical protein
LVEYAGEIKEWKPGSFVELGFRLWEEITKRIAMIPIYQSNGAWVAVYDKGNIFNVDGEWLGFLVGREVFDPAGMYLGFMSDDQRLLRKRSISDEPPHHTPPPRPKRPRVPANMPLSPLMRELPHQIIDLFEEFPERLIYVSETRPDME